MLADADLASIGRALGDAHRARFVLALIGGEELPAGELAARAGTSSSLPSPPLAKLLESGLVTARAQGRQRYYSIASAQIAESIEALLAIAPHQDAVGLTSVTRGKALQRARTCYDHLAGQLVRTRPGAAADGQRLGPDQRGRAEAGAPRAGCGRPAREPAPLPSALPGLDRAPPARG